MEGLPRKIKSRIIIYFGGIFALFGINLVVLADYQLYEHATYVLKAQKQRERQIRLNPKRGTIYDAAGRDLAISIDVDSIFAHPDEIEVSDSLIADLAKILGETKKGLADMLKDERSFVWLKRHISPGQRESIEALDLKGIGFLKESKRYYPKRFLGGQILGFAGIDNQGLEGIEKGYDRELKGTEGWYIAIRDARKRAILSQQWWVKMPTSGGDLVLSIDEVIQYFAEKELARICLDENARGGTVVVMEPQTGAVLAMANYPPFNPNNFGRSDQGSSKNKAVVDVFEPGSTMKPMVFSGAFEENLINPEMTFNCRHGELHVANHTIKDWRRFDMLTAREVLGYSSNVGTITISERLGQKRLYSYLQKFGFGRLSGIDFPGETPGILYPTSRWSGLSLPCISIGYEVSVSALQMTNAYASIANDGIMMVPRMVKEIRNEQGQVIKIMSPQVSHRTISTPTARLMKDLMQGVVAWGTGGAAYVPGYDVCGKTGTAKRIDKRTGRYSSQKVLASFIGFAPKENPAIIIGVFIEEPMKNKWASSAAAPAFKRIMEDVLRYRQIKPSYIDTIKVENLSAGISDLAERALVKETAHLATSDRPSAGAVL